MAVVSVVIPAYNPGPFLEEAVRSVIEQTFGDWEVIVVDDGSDEDLSGMASIDPRVTVLRQSNQGLSRARNAGIAAGKSEFVAFLDADDRWLPTKLERQLEVLFRSGAALSATAFEIIDERGKRISDGYTGHRESYLELLTGNGIAVSSVLVRRDVLESLGGFDESLDQVQDWHLWLRIAKRLPLAHVEDVLAQYRSHGANMSRNYRRFLSESRRVLFEHRTGEAECAAIERGWRQVRTLAGAQSFDAFRVDHDPRDLLFAIRYAPRLTVSQLRRFVLARVPFRHGRSGA